MMYLHLQMLLMQAMAGDVRRGAAARRRQHPSQPPAVVESRATLRLSSQPDEGPLARLADLDSATPSRLPIPLAELDGDVVAALPLSDGAIVANPFCRTTSVVELPHARTRQLEGGSESARWHLVRSWSRMRSRGYR